MSSGVVKDDAKIIIADMSGTGNEMQVTRFADGHLYIELEEPWAGSTETGFGATAKMSMTWEQAAALTQWLRERPN